MKKKDAELIQRTLDGEKSAFTALVEKYQKGVHALAWQKIGDFHIAQEITQDAFLRAYQKLGTLKNHNLFSGWLYVIATRLCCEWLRKKRLPMQSLETVDNNEVDQVAYTQYMEEQREADADENRRELVRDLLKKLPESERTVMTLHYLGEMTCESIGEFLGVSSNTIRSRLSRARNRLKKEENMIKENLSSFQLPTQMTENIMKEISRFNPVAPSGSKPLVPLAVSAISAVFVLLLMGIGAQNLYRFQKPYSLNAQSEPMIEILEAQLVIDSLARPAVRNHVGHSDITGKSNGEGQKPDDPLFAAANADRTEVSKSKSQWVQTKGPEGGAVSTLFKTTRGNIYAGAEHGLYRLTDDGQAWKFISKIKGPSRSTKATRRMWWPVVERQDILYLATNKEILASSDRGENWETLCKCPEGQLVGMVITDGNQGPRSNIVVYLAYTNGIYRTVDFGKSWIPLSEGVTDRKIRAIAAIENTVFAGTDKGLFRFNNEIWEHLPISQEDRSGKITDSIFALTTSDNRLYVSAKKKNAAINRNQTHQQIEIKTSSSNINRVEVTNNTGDSQLPNDFAIYRSIDLGESWDSITPKLDGDLKKDSYTVDIPSLSADKDGVNTVLLNTTAGIIASGKKVIVMTSKAEYYSGDAGENWTRIEHPDNVAYASDTALLNGNTFYRGGTQGIQRSTDAGKSWHQFNTGLVNTNVKHLNVINGVLFANTETGFVNSTDKGESWTSVPGHIGDLMHIVEFDDELYARAYAKGTFRHLRLSSEDNRLKSISGIPSLEFMTADKFMVIVIDENQMLLKSSLGSFAVTDTAYYVKYNDKLFRWSIGTLNWYDIGVTDVDKFAVSGETVYVGKQNGHLLQSFDEGNTWNDMSTVMANLPFTVESFNTITFAGETVYVATDKGVIRSSYGTDWHILTDVEGTPLVVDRFAVDGTTVFGHAGQKVYQVKEDSDTWEQIKREIPYPVNCFDVDGNMLYVGTSGRGVLSFTLDE